VSRVSTRTRAVIACAAVAVLLAACGASPDSTSTGPPPDLFQALPEPAAPPTVIVATPTAVPSATKKAKPKPATGTPSGRGTARGAAAAGQTPAEISAKWKPVGGDEFNGSTLDAAKWGTYDSVGAFGNGTRSPSAISESGGSLHITARNVDGGISGGMADSLGQVYGRWEFRARTDLGRGFGSAILLWPDSEQLSDGELDIMEVPNEKRDLANFVVHSGPQGQTTVGTALPGNFSQWHTFAIEWLPDSITWYVDGRQQYKLTDKSAIPTQPMHLAIQLDQGPKQDWIEAPDATTPAEINLDVDWVHVYAPRTAIPAPPTTPTAPATPTGAPSE
jgi:beta-glucanase (GH16 family)